MSLMDSIFPLRELGLGELEQLQARPAPQPTELTELKNSHFRLARLTAQGLKTSQIASITGYSVGTILSLQNNNPAFQALVEEYREECTQEMLDVTREMAKVGMLAVEELGDRLALEPSGFSNRELLEVMRDTLPRAAGSGVSSSSTPAPVTINFVTPEPPAGVVIEGRSSET